MAMKKIGMGLNIFWPVYINVSSVSSDKIVYAAYVISTKISCIPYFTQNGQCM